jgi:UDP-N-acetylmuramoyl-tripeptide--D-alanyl-D-alanine ligase
MMRLNLHEVAGFCQGQTEHGAIEICGMSHDTRLIEPGNLFVALPGERVDGHTFLDAAARAGAAAALVARPVNHELPQVRVDDVLKAMGRIGAGWRDRQDLTVIGVTGSNGKTTVKEMITTILSAQAPTLASEGNYNNEIGLPLTLARLSPDHRYAVLEMGASHPGDIRYLAELARPDIGLVTNAAPAHLEGFGSLEGVARTKGEMFQALPDNGMAVINADDRFFSLWQKLAGHCRQLSFGLGHSADVRGCMVNGSAEVHTSAGTLQLSLGLPGRHNLMNALAALAVASHAGLDLQAATAALSSMRSLPGRLNLHRDAAGWCLIDDTYNANPASLYAGLQVLAELQGEAWLVLGDMAELGPDSDKLHAEMGQAASDLGVRRLFAVGTASRASTTAFGPGGKHFDSHQALSEALSGALGPGVNCLVKGSRSMAMEQIVQALIGEKS